MEGKAPYGGFWIRFVAAFIDSLLLLMPLTLVSMVAQTVLSEASAQILSWVMSTLLQVMYFGIIQGELQTTVGKKIVGLCVVNERFEKLGFGRGIARYFIYNLSFLPLGAGVIWAAFHPKKQGWHDLTVGSLVLRADYVAAARAKLAASVSTPQPAAPSDPYSSAA